MQLQKVRKFEDLCVKNLHKQACTAEKMLNLQQEINGILLLFYALILACSRNFFLKN